MFAAFPVRNRAFVALVFAALLAASLSGCAVVNTINKVRHAVNGNQAVIQSFTEGLKAAQSSAFEVTYKTTGGSPTTVTYAAQPPKDVAFTQAAAGGSDGTSDLDLVSNAQGEYSCSRASAGAAWSCQKLSKIEALAQNQLVDFYTPSHWITFLRTFSIAAGIAGDKVTTSSLTVNGFPMKCVDFHAKGTIGQSTICTTAQNILGYVKVAGESTSFEITSYKSAPASSLFLLPAGATVTKSG
jgi:outer membrane lipoprotein-sorting protein